MNRHGVVVLGHIRYSDMHACSFLYMNIADRLTDMAILPFDDTDMASMLCYQVET